MTRFGNRVLVWLRVALQSFVFHLNRKLNLTKGVWWYSHYTIEKSDLRLNGLFLHGGNGANGASWYKWKKAQYSLKKADMKVTVRPVTIIPSYWLKLLLIKSTENRWNFLVWMPLWHVAQKQTIKCEPDLNKVVISLLCADYFLFLIVVFYITPTVLVPVHLYPLYIPIPRIYIPLQPPFPLYICSVVVPLTNSIFWSAKL